MVGKTPTPRFLAPVGVDFHFQLSYPHSNFHAAIFSFHCHAEEFSLFLYFPACDDAILIIVVPTVFRGGGEGVVVQYKGTTRRGAYEKILLPLIGMNKYYKGLCKYF